MYQVCVCVFVPFVLAPVYTPFDDILDAQPGSQQAHAQNE